MNDAMLIARLLALADEELILGQRDSEWTGHAPLLEEDIAFSNIAQDEIGHALLWYTILHEQLGQPHPDRLAFWRDADEFRNATLVELPKGDWAFTIVRQYLFDEYEKARNAALARCGYQPIEDAVNKIAREEVYHLMHSSGWVRRLGSATEESHRRMQAALDEVWRHVPGLFEPIEHDEEFSLQLDQIKPAWVDTVTATFVSATLIIPPNAPPIFSGRHGQHTKHLTALLHEMQKVARSEAPDVMW
ncbi:MAG TPA: 1,2-phenylacetyl-CoA epoxidase subunit PaaC [Anaerolineae bacterium]|nr:1,2-phenylacetyl-CoA epoxidase subunit PaaC [Anaerolineae bacterium]